MEHARLYELWLLDAAIGNQLGAEKINPFSILGVSDHLLVSAIPCKKFPVGRDIKVDRPFITLKVVPHSFSAGDHISRQPEVFSSRRLQVIPNRLPIGAP